MKKEYSKTVENEKSQKHAGKELYCGKQRRDAFRICSPLSCVVFTDNGEHIGKIMDISFKGFRVILKFVVEKDEFYPFEIVADNNLRSGKKKKSEATGVAKVVHVSIVSAESLETSEINPDSEQEQKNISEQKTNELETTYCIAGFEFEILETGALKAIQKLIMDEQRKQMICKKKNNPR